MATVVGKTVKEVIDNNHIVIYSKSYCLAIQDYLFELTNQKTVPNIFIAQKHIGGSDDLSELYDSGALLPLVTQKPTRFNRNFIDYNRNNNFWLGLIILTSLIGFGFFVKKRKNSFQTSNVSTLRKTKV
ncbi:hypothetical protein O181_001047 [Austropuccinia psidii MF-1]|uniref:Glutaredoxin domain-containing protein n=1 Tax=Austropuccinia psidii MF-1 TaxID=1389203 RepID=A0A9Q3B9U4_9BASI|nr:hypothetical protein [Austropuccinia psidii MF-1]